MHREETTLGEGVEVSGQTCDGGILFGGRETMAREVHTANNEGGGMADEARGLADDVDNAAVGTTGEEHGVRSFFYDEALLVGERVW